GLPILGHTGTGHRSGGQQAERGRYERMHATRDELPVMLAAGDASVRGAEWGEMRVTLVSVPAGTDFGPLLRGLPNDRCQGPHWGYVLKGRLRIQYADGEETLSG